MDVIAGWYHFWHWLVVVVLVNSGQKPTSGQARVANSRTNWRCRKLVTNLLKSEASEHFVCIYIYIRMYISMYVYMYVNHTFVHIIFMSIYMYIHRCRWFYITNGGWSGGNHPQQQIRKDFAFADAALFGMCHKSLHFMPLQVASRIVLQRHWVAWSGMWVFNSFEYNLLFGNMRVNGGLAIQCSFSKDCQSWFDKECTMVQRFSLWPL